MECWERIQISGLDFKVPVVPWIVTLSLTAGFTLTMADQTYADMSDLLLQFSMRGISTQNDLPLSTAIYNSITAVVSSEKIKAVQINPSEKWPQNVVIACADLESKRLLEETGLELYGTPVELNEGGIGAEKIFIKGAPLDMPNHVIIQELRKFGDYIAMRSQAYYAGKTKTDWNNGTRVAFLRNVKNALPPTLLCEFNGYQRKIAINHEGQTLFECRWCKKHIPRTIQHTCEKKPEKRGCFNCKAVDHLNADCPHPRSCTECSSTSHIAKNCPRRLRGGQQTSERPQPGPNVAEGTRRNFTLGEFLEAAPPRPQRPPRPSRPPTFPRGKKRRIQLSGGTPPINEEGDTTANSAPEGSGARDRVFSARESLNESIQNQAHGDLFTQGSVDCVLVGTSNCHGLPLRGDDGLELRVDHVVQGGLKINQGSNKLASDVAPAQLLEKTAVILHLGGPDFPVDTNSDIDRLYTQYVDLAVDVSIRCPNARIFISSIPPRKGSLKTKINRDIKRMNSRLSQLADQEEKITFVNNDRFLTDGQVTIAPLYEDKEEDDIHLSLQGKIQLANYLFDFVKNDFYKDRLASDMEARV